ncbi:RNA-directed DNA polymerase homolog [Rhizophagus clarus]|uniref:RNA-directed DNA polymerase homolog n=1 Tax=Rhizophagus clarus TaxID=94130 RepID=A0A8H3LHM0_9GLOM|nr:RNA-directed DNA polymerase homolog [Rhizophagus clarus]
MKMENNGIIRKKLNVITKADVYPFSRIDDLLESLDKPSDSLITTLNLASGYWQIAMNEDSIDKTAFVTLSGLYKFLVMPFGLSYASEHVVERDEIKPDLEKIDKVKNYSVLTNLI